jgi:hypothetical protein
MDRLLSKQAEKIKNSCILIEYLEGKAHLQEL